jgi:hypothetical protein
MAGRRRRSRHAGGQARPAARAGNVGQQKKGPIGPVISAGESAAQEGEIVVLSASGARMRANSTAKPLSR